MTTAPFPGASVPATANNFFTYPWLTFFQRLASQPGAPVTVPGSTSPLIYVAPSPGSFLMNGGTISDREFTRGTTTVQFISNIITMAAGDKVTITFTGTPAFTFIPA